MYLNLNTGQWHTVCKVHIDNETSKPALNVTIFVKFNKNAQKKQTRIWETTVPALSLCFLSLCCKDLFLMCVSLGWIWYSALTHI